MAGIIGNPDPPAKSWTERFGKLFRRKAELVTETRSLDDHVGYPKLATFQTIQPVFSIYRGFNYLYGRTLLEMQHEITTLERQLDMCDAYDAQDKNGRAILLASIRRDIRDNTANNRPGDASQPLNPAPPGGSPYNTPLNDSLNPAAWSHPASWTQPPIPMQLLSNGNLPSSLNPGAPIPQPDPIPQTFAAQGPPYRRRKIIAELRKKLKDYGELLIVARDVAAFNKPSDRAYQSVRIWLDNYRPITEKEAQIFNMKEDLVTLDQERQWAKFDGLLTKFMMKFPYMQKWLTTPELQAKTGEPHIKLVHNPYAQTIASFILTFVLCLLLAAPIVVMYILNVSNSSWAVAASLVVLVAFVLLFNMAMMLFTNAGRNEMFAASAAYCAVLVVFISNFASNFCTAGA